MTRSQKTYKPFSSNRNCSPTKRRMTSGKDLPRANVHEPDEELEELCRDFAYLGVLEDDRDKRVLWSITYEQNSKSTQTINTDENFCDNKSTQTRQELSPDFCYQDEKKSPELSDAEMVEVSGRGIYEPPPPFQSETGYQSMFKLVDRRNAERGNFSPNGRYLRPRGHWRGLPRASRRGPRGRRTLGESYDRVTTIAEINEQPSQPTSQIKHNDQKDGGLTGPFMTPEQYRDWISQPF